MAVDYDWWGPRVIWYVLGAISACIAIAAGAYVILLEGLVVHMAVHAPEFPFESAVAHMSLRASYSGSLNLKSPIPANEENIAEGAKIFSSHCAGCHGHPQTSSQMAKRMFPPPPQLLQSRDMVTDDPVGKIHWIVTNGIRMSGMPEFRSALSDTQRWQIVLMLKHADKLPPAAQAALTAH